MTSGYSVIGHPIGHTASPFIHNKLFALSKKEENYSTKDISPEYFNDSLNTLREMSGFNVTIPHKQRIIPYLENITSVAELSGSVNCVKIENGKMYGTSTDGYGFLSALKIAGFPYQDISVGILGCGGAARAISVALCENGCDVTFYCRDINSENAKSIICDLSKSGFEAKLKSINDYFDRHDLCVNATPVGMYPKTEDSAITKEQLSAFKFLFDTIYNPSETLLMKYAKELDIKCCGGTAMLVCQAVKSHEFWYGGQFNNENILKLIDDTNKFIEKIFTKNIKKIALCGFMGCGKTTVGKILAEKLGFKFIDCDKYIEENFGIPVSEIFKQYSENKFRELETNALETLSNEENIIFALGGGAPMFPKNQEILNNDFCTVYISVETQNLFERLKGDTTRPLLAGGDLYDKIKTLEESRKPTYISVSDFIIDGGSTPDYVADSIIKQLKLKED